MIVAALYILAVLAANLTATWFLPLPWYGQVSVATFAFGTTFTLRDRLHHRGRRWVYAVIALAAVVNVAAALALGTPGRVIVASFTAIVLAEAVDTEVFAVLRRRAWVVRVLGSNAVSVPLDTILFTLIAFWGVLPAADLLALIVGETVVKWTIGAMIALWRPSWSTAPAMAVALPRSQ